jgi:hypothetical protein
MKLSMAVITTSLCFILNTILHQLSQENEFVPIIMTDVSQQRLPADGINVKSMLLIRLNRPSHCCTTAHTYIDNKVSSPTPTHTYIDNKVSSPTPTHTYIDNKVSLPTHTHTHIDNKVSSPTPTHTYIDNKVSSPTPTHTNIDNKVSSPTPTHTYIDNKVSSPTTTLGCHHVLVQPDDDLVVLKVQHAEGQQASGYAARGRRHAGTLLSHKTL